MKQIRPRRWVLAMIGVAVSSMVLGVLSLHVSLDEPGGQGWTEPPPSPRRVQVSSSSGAPVDAAVREAPAEDEPLAVDVTVWVPAPERFRMARTGGMPIRSGGPPLSEGPVTSVGARLGRSLLRSRWVRAPKARTRARLSSMGLTPARMGRVLSRLHPAFGVVGLQAQRAWDTEDWMAAKGDARKDLWQRVGMTERQLLDHAYGLPPAEQEAYVAELDALHVPRPCGQRMALALRLAESGEPWTEHMATVYALQALGDGPMDSCDSDVDGMRLLAHTLATTESRVVAEEAINQLRHSDHRAPTDGEQEQLRLATERFPGLGSDIAARTLLLLKESDDPAAVQRWAETILQTLPDCVRDCDRARDNAEWAREALASQGHLEPKTFRESVQRAFFDCSEHIRAKQIVRGTGQLQGRWTWTWERPTPVTACFEEHVGDYPQPVDGTRAEVLAKLFRRAP